MLAAAGCFTGEGGGQPDPNRLYFPTGLVMSPGGTTLYVANSDFDLQFAGGTVQALDARALRQTVRGISETIAEHQGASAEACAAAGLAPNPDPWLNPGPCSALPVAPFIERASFIGAFASGLLLVHDPSQVAARLFVPVRGDPSITYFDVEDDRGAGEAFEPSFQLDCLQGADGFCADDHRVGQDRERTLRGLQLPADPFGIAASSDGVAIVSAHQTEAAASVIVNDWSGRPALSYFTSGLPPGPTEVAAIPEPGFVALARADAAAAGRTFVYRPSFGVTFRSASELDVLAYFDDSGAVPPRPFISRTQQIPLTVSASNFDSRGLTIVDAERRRCEGPCQTDQDPLGCLVACAETNPLKAYLANRSPASLLIGRVETFVNRALVDGEQVITSAFEVVTMHDQIPLGFGASRVESGRVVDQHGELVDRVFAVAFDSRAVFVYDPYLERIELTVRTGRGPHDIAVDAGIDAEGQPYSYLYVGHFTDSYIGVVDLDRRRPHTFGQMIATVGAPTPPKESR